MRESGYSGRALVIAPRFFGYDKQIVAELVRFGYEVDLLPDRPSDAPLFKAFYRVFPEIGGRQFSEKFYSEQLESLSGHNYSIILVIQGEGVTSRTLSRLRANYPRACIIFYTWDSIENKPYSLRNLKFYDRCASFDPVDAKKYDLVFRPLFYSPNFERSTQSEYKYDVSFVGTVHSDRYQIVSALVKQLPIGYRSFIHLYLQAPWMFNYRRLLTNSLAGAKRDEFRYFSLSLKQVQEVFFESRVVLDIEHPKQRGATMRTIEAIGSCRKMITTNGWLRDYDFYSPENIMIVDRLNPILDLEFLTSPYVELPEEIRSRYSLAQWVREVCNL